MTSGGGWRRSIGRARQAGAPNPTQQRRPVTSPACCRLQKHQEGRLSTRVRQQVINADVDRFQAAVERARQRLLDAAGGGGGGGEAEDAATESYPGPPAMMV